MILILEKDSPQIYELPINAALIAIAEHHGWSVELRHSSFWTNIPTSSSQQLLVWNTGLPWDGHLRTEFKQKNPASKIVTMGGDLHYFGLYEKFDWTAVDLHLDPMPSVVDKLKSVGVPAAHFYWSISEFQVSKIKSIMMGASSECRSIDALGVYRATPYREKLFGGLAARGLKTCLSPQEYDFDKLIGLYASSLVHVGTTSPVYGTSGLRSMKGFRDWIAPFCGTVLVYDDYEGCSAWEGIVPFYRYGDAEGLSSLIGQIRNDNYFRAKCLENQINWAKKHSTDAQFTQIFRAFKIT